jgi:phosphatidylserine/phosphatidylglycerophosphate/cardiolipin synthase-like enzyme
LKLLVQPGDGIADLLKGIDGAKKTVDIVIFRMDISQIERALGNAVSRGVRVRALIAWTNRGGEQSLRALETRLLGAGVTVSRTADDLVRYHGKMMIADSRKLYVLAFNFIHLDVEHSRSFGVITTNKRLVAEAEKLFEADSQRQTYTAADTNLVISPVNARQKLSSFIRGVRRELRIYDQELSDPEMIALLHEMMAKGVTVRLIGKQSRTAGLPARRLTRMRQHTRMIVRDNSAVFLGSQSLRALELDRRREVGIIFRDTEVAGRLAKIYDEDWEAAEAVPAVRTERKSSQPVRKIAKAVAKHVVQEMPAVASVMEMASQQLGGESIPRSVDQAQLQADLEGAVKSAVKEVVREALENALVASR